MLPRVYARVTPLDGSIILTKKCDLTLKGDAVAFWHHI